MLLILFSVIVTFILAVVMFMQSPKFGNLPSGERQARILQSPNFRNGEFQNLNHTPQFADGVNMLDVLRTFFFGDKVQKMPVGKIPTKKTDLKHLPPQSNLLVWFGHSSYFMQIDGKKMLIDPVCSGAASPVSFTTRSFAGSDVYTADDFPEIDYLFLSHDHWDHLDYATVLALKAKTKKIICGLGVGAHLQRWGFDMRRVEERDWNEAVALDSGFVVHTAPARHFSGRGFTRNKSLWMSFVLKTPTMKLYLGGDSGYDTHFAAIGAAHGPFDLAILECGQYDDAWPYIHMHPHQIPQAAHDLKAKRLMPVHWAKFALANHNWKASIERVSAEAAKQAMPLVTPMIGEAVSLDTMPSTWQPWWKTVE